MSRYPSCTWKPISGTSTTPVTKDILCLHTMVGYLTSTWSYFNRPDVGVYSHIGVGGPWGADAGKNLDGVAWQMADTNYRAAANLNGNPRIISVETADNAPASASDIVAWTPKQCDKIVEIMVDAHRIDGIPLVLIPDSKPGRRGIAYHRLGCDPYRVAGGELWSSAYGKTCPTDARIRQIPGLISRAIAIVNGTTPPEEDMPLSGSDEQFIKQCVNDCIENKFGLLTGTNFALGIYGATSNNGAVSKLLNTQDPGSLVSLIKAIAAAQVAQGNALALLADDESQMKATVAASTAELKAAIDALDDPQPAPAQLAVTHPVDPNNPHGV